MIKVDEIKYSRADLDGAREKLRAFCEKAKSVTDGRGLANVRQEALAVSRAVSTAATLAEIRFAQNTADEFYLGEKNYYDENLPHFNAECVEFEKAFLASRHLSAALDFVNPNVAKVYELNIRTGDARVAGITAEESKKETEYSMLMSGMLFDFGGERMPLSVLTKYMSDARVDVRRSAAEVLGRRLARSAKKLDGIFDDLVKIRTKKAKLMGLPDYSVMGDMQMNRYSYGRADIAAYRDKVVRERVPSVAQSKAALGKELGLTKFMLYDDEIYFDRGNPQPRGGANGIFAAAREMYRSMGSETAEFFNFMEDSGAFDVLPRENKWGGGFCTNLDGYDQPFILANFNGSSGDVDVLTHEAGHALAFYLGARSGVDYELMQTMTMSISEVHSMAMEYFAYPHADKFFDRPDDYRRMHMESSLAFIPYGCMVDEFEETCYRQPDMTPAERNGLWLDLEKKYRPYLSAEGISYLERGTRWQYQAHIYESPMYYIDYCLAAEVALEFYRLSQTDYSAALSKYFEWVRLGGELSFWELFTHLRGG